MLLVALIFLLSLPAPSAGGNRSFCTDADGTHKPNSTYRSNLRSLADELIARATKSHSATGMSGGASSDKAYGAVLCRGDSTGADCGRLLREAFESTINAVCALHRDVAFYSELYQLRFSDKDFLSTFSNAPEWVDGTNLNLVPDAEAGQFDEVVAELTRTLAEAAAEQPDRYKTADAPWPSRERERRVYGLAQCTQDMPPDRCRVCLYAIAAEIRRKIGSGKMGGAIHGAQCTLRYETDTQFFATTGQREDHALLIIGTVYSLSVICTRLLFWLLCIIRRRRKGGETNSMEQRENMDEVLRLWKSEDTNSEFSLYDFAQIADATDNFSSSQILGEGGFGPVYKEVAIKRLAARSRQGLVEFKNEIQLVAKLQHRHLVRLLGCCVHNEEKILIYEYMTNKSLDYFIFDPIRRTSLNWKIRMKIVEGIAQGLLYLHEHSRLRIIHRDLKAGNILLDVELIPKISDFGMARIFPSDATQTKASRLVGTYGYMAPEYAFEGLLSIKSDVFSFGVLLLEIISGRRSAGFQHYGEFQNLLQYAWQMWKDKRWNEFSDQSFGDECKPGDMMKYLTLALMCVQVKAIDRPTMSNVVTMLNSDEISIPEPRQPAYSYIRADVSVNVNVSCSRNDVTLTTVDGR
ncbi:cysteine-rich receptor-like protein kinase 6 isoform X2 [Brachypodium distachyon]|uniref:cysteine-rich receptor-like protein kinase 6 isoform X2 n=1 Tax=Brachypodium distachyon TaxID=15368 RepID=UPI0005300AF6|nr:cysteine-rich receptor-like protein kinase 6 isoform X2 [Brachypodium distachyon]|eukprot:XP_010237494.1 cysteine-rich receptor-like protein kinase 6 isoform X2 [Brachypodium distachyon]